jgi:hypothetical protein
LAPFGDRVSLIETDLNTDGWQTRLVGDIHAIVTMQSLHDLGDERQVKRIYSVAKELLAPGGLLLNADLLPDLGPDVNPNPGRLTAARHLDLLNGQGFADVACTLELERFSCCVARQPA